MRCNRMTSPRLTSIVDSYVSSLKPLLAQTMAVLFDLYYDLTCQDLAPEFKDRHETFFAEGTSYLMQLMAWDPLQLQGIRGHTTRVRLWRAACV